MASERQKISSTKDLLRDRNMLIVFAVTLSATMGVSIISPALPKLAGVFDVGRGDAIILITAFTLPAMIVAPFYGILADRIGRKRILVLSLTLFGVAGAACGFARAFWLLIVLRFFQGLGGSGLFTLNNTIIGDLYSGRKRLHAMGLNASLISVSMALYPAIGGVIAGIHWSVPFFAPVLAVIVAMLVLFTLENPEPTESVTIRGYLKNALADMSRWSIIRLFILNFVSFVLLFGPIIAFVPMWMDLEYGSTASVIGFIVSAASFSAAVVSAQLNWIEKYLQTGSMLMIAFFIYTLALYVIPSIPSPSLMLIPAILFGVAQGLNVPTVQSLVAGAAPFRLRGAYMAINSTLILTGVTTGPLLGSLAYKTVGVKSLYYIAGAGALAMAIILAIRGSQLNEDISTEE